VNAGLLQEMNLVDWAQAPNEQHVKRLLEHTVLKQATIYEVSTELELAKKFAAPRTGRDNDVGGRREGAGGAIRSGATTPHSMPGRQENGCSRRREDEPPPRALPGPTADGKKAYPEQTMTADEMETGVKE
jgi:hypothetical protein